MENVVEITKIARIRTVNECYDEIKALDPACRISTRRIRAWAKDGIIRHFVSGKATLLINLDDLLRVLNEGLPRA
jgi:hypothetical protein